MFTEEELVWIRGVLDDYEPFEVSPSFFYKQKMEYERNERREIVRRKLDNLRDTMIEFTPEELVELRKEDTRERLGIENILGIYIIHNSDREKYYIGKSEKVFDRSYKHFVKELGNDEVYEDYCLGDKFHISIIPLESTMFLTLDELEDSAIRSYDALFPSGYNKLNGNILGKPIFKNDDYQKVSDLILDRIKRTEVFWDLTNDKKRVRFIGQLFKEFNLPYNPNFRVNFRKVIKEYQKANKKVK